MLPISKKLSGKEFNETEKPISKKLSGKEFNETEKQKEGALDVFKCVSFDY